MAPTGETGIQLCGRLVVRLDGQRVEDSLPGALGPLLFAYLVLVTGSAGSSATTC